MQEVSRPPRIITALSEQDRLLISQLIQEKDNLGMAWLEKLRKFISFHNRNLKKISIERFKDEATEHLLWLKEIFCNQIINSNNTLIDSALLNAALIVSDACEIDNKQNTFLEEVLIQHTNKLVESNPVNLEILGEAIECNYSFNKWSSADIKKNPVTIFCPSPFSLFSITVLKILLSLKVEVKAVVILKFSHSRIRSELYRDGLGLFIKRVWRKLILRSDENNDSSELSLKVLKNSIAPGVSDIRKLAKAHNVNCISVNDFSESLNLKKNNDGDLCIFTGGGLIDSQVLDYFSLGVINIHMGPLPQYKGMDVVEAPILDGHFKNIALTSHLMEPALDAGPLISEIIFSSDEYKTLGELRNEMGALMPIIAVDSVISILSDTAQPIKQKPSGQQYYFIHHRLREIISIILPIRNKALNQKNSLNRRNHLKAFKLLISDIQNNR